jgi:hypothetical protein
LGKPSRQRRKRSALSLNVFAVRPSISKTLADDAFSEFVGTVLVVNAQGNAVVMAEVKMEAANVAGLTIK